MSHKDAKKIRKFMKAQNIDWRLYKGVYKKFKKEAKDA